MHQEGVVDGLVQAREVQIAPCAHLLQSSSLPCSWGLRPFGLGSEREKGGSQYCFEPAVHPFATRIDHSTFERRATNLKHFEDFPLRVNATILSGLAYVCHVRSTAERTCIESNHDEKQKGTCEWSSLPVRREG